MADQWQSVLTGGENEKLASTLTGALAAIKSAQEVNKSYMLAAKTSYEAAKALNLSEINIILSGIQGFISDIQDTLTAYENLGYYFINIDPWTISTDPNSPNAGSYKTTATDLVPAYRTDAGELLPIKSPVENATGLHTGTDKAGSTVTQENLNLGLTQIGVTVPQPIKSDASQDSSKPTIGHDGIPVMSPQQCIDELKLAFDDKGDLERPVFPGEAAEMAGVVVIAASDSPSEMPDLIGPLAKIFEVDSLKALGDDLAALYTPKPQTITLKNVCGVMLDAGGEEIFNNNGATPASFEIGQYIRRNGPGHATVGKITKVESTVRQVIQKELVSQYPIDYVNIFLHSVAQYQSRRVGSSASGLIANVVGGIPGQIVGQGIGLAISDITSESLAEFLGPVSGGRRGELVDVNTYNVQLQKITYEPLKFGGNIMFPGDTVQLAEYLDNAPANHVVRDELTGQKVYMTNREVAGLPEDTIEKLAEDFKIVKPTVTKSAIVGECFKQEEPDLTSFAPDFKSLTIIDIIPQFGELIDRIRAQVDALSESIKPSSRAIDLLIESLDAKISDIEAFAQVIDDFQTYILGIFEFLLSAGVYILYLDPQPGGVAAFKKRLDDAVGIPALPAGTAFAFIAGGPAGGNPSPTDSIITLANFLGLTVAEASAVVTATASEEKKDDILVRGQKEPNEGGLVIEANVRIYYELTQKAPIGWAYNSLLDDFTRIGEEQTLEEKLSALLTYETLINKITQTQLIDLKKQLDQITLTTIDTDGAVTDLPLSTTKYSELTTLISTLEISSAEILNDITLRRKQLLASKANAISSSGNTVILTTGSWGDFNIDQGSIVAINTASTSQSAGDVRTVSFVTNTSVLSTEQPFSTDLDQEQAWFFTVPEPDISNTISTKTVKQGVLQKFQGDSGEIILNNDGIDKMTFLTIVMPNFPVLPFPHALTGNTELLVLNAKTGGFSSVHKTEEYNWEKYNLQLGDEISVGEQTVKVVYVPYEQYLPVDTDGTGVYNTFPETAPKSHGGNGLGDKNSVVVIPWPPEVGANDYFAVLDNKIKMEPTTTLLRTKAFNPEVAAEENFTVKTFIEIEQEKEAVIAAERQVSLELKDSERLKNFTDHEDALQVIVNQVNLIDSNVS